MIEEKLSLLLNTHSSSSVQTKFSTNCGMDECVGWGEADGKGLFIVEFEEIVGYFTVKITKQVVFKSY